MEKTRPVRIPVYIEVDLITGGNSYAGFIGNLSETGVYVETTHTKTVLDFLPGSELELEFQGHSGETQNLQCEVTWLYTKIMPSQNLTSKLGMGIIDPPLTYKEFFKTL